MAQGVHRSVRRGWDGYMVVAETMHSNWGGYSPAELDDEHTKPVLLFLTNEDWETKKMGEWLATQLRNTRVKYGEGRNLGGLFVLDDIWADFMSQFP